MPRDSEGRRTPARSISVDQIVAWRQQRRNTRRFDVASKRGPVICRRQIHVMVAGLKREVHFSNLDLVPPAPSLSPPAFFCSRRTLAFLFRYIQYYFFATHTSLLLNILSNDQQSELSSCLASNQGANRALASLAFATQPPITTQWQD